MLPCMEGRGVNTEFVPCMGCPQGCVPRVLPQVCWQWDLLGSFGRGYLCLGEVVAAASPSKIGKQNQEESPGNGWGWPGSRCCSLVRAKGFEVPGYGIKSNAAEGNRTGKGRFQPAVVISSGRHQSTCLRAAFRDGFQTIHLAGVPVWSPATLRYGDAAAATGPAPVPGEAQDLLLALPAPCWVSSFPLGARDFPQENPKCCLSPREEPQSPAAR